MKRKLLQFLLIASSLANDQIDLKSAQLGLDTSSVSRVTGATLELFRQNQGPLFAPNHCYELYISSPYLDPQLYSTFTADNQPVCEPLLPGFQVECKASQADTLEIVLTSMTEEFRQKAQMLVIGFTNFHTPFSSQIIKTINMRSYSDLACTKNMKAVEVPGITILEEEMPVSGVALSSDSDQLGFSGAANELTVKFTPKTTMSPSGKGTVQIGVPMWWQIGRTGERMYAATAKDKCYSDCMKVIASQLQDSQIVIDYQDMPSKCIKGTQITIKCKQFYNPITPDIWPGFQVTIYDSEFDSRVIERTVDELSFDATNFKPMIMPKSTFVVDPADSMIATFSRWTISLNVNIPLQTECYIKIFVPNEFQYDIKQVEATGIFLPQDLDPQLNEEDLNSAARGEDPSIDKSSIKLHGCNSLTELGRSPFGRLYIQNIRTQEARLDSGTFELTIYKDKEMTKKIAVLTDGVRITKDALVSGSLLDVSITPGDYRVQRLTTILIEFTITHTLHANAGLTIQMPSGLTLPGAGKKVVVESPDGSSDAVEGEVFPGNIIVIYNLVSSESKLPGTRFKVLILGIKNQNSVRDAGRWSISTTNKVGDQQFEVDAQDLDSSFFAETGAITPLAEIGIPNPKCNERANIYTFVFELEDELPKAGYIKLLVPDSISLSPSTTQSSGSCKNYTCTEATSNSVTFLMQGGIKALTKFTLEVGGITNPRSQKPTGGFRLITYDSDAESEIDSGFDLAATMTIPGEILSFSFQQSSFTNGELNTFTFSVQASIPLLWTDSFTFTLPAEMHAPSDITCQEVLNIKEPKCTVSDRAKITLTFSDLQNAEGAFSWQIPQIRNPPSTQPSTPFADVMFTDKDGYTISKQTEPLRVTNKFPAQIAIYDLLQSNRKPQELSSYDLIFTPVNALPENGSIQITYPTQISMTKGAQTRCVVTLIQADGSAVEQRQSCSVDPEANIISVKGAFAQVAPYHRQISVKLFDVRNAENNKPGNGFMIQTYTDDAQTFNVDKLNDFILKPKFDCDYPCQTCVQGDSQSCQTCWENFDDPQYLMFYAGRNECKSFCDVGFTTNGHKQKHCSKCDVSCKSCSENGQVGDAQKCIDCADDFTYRLSMTQTCLKECVPGTYETPGMSCRQCRAPCMSCTSTESTCTSCKPGTKLQYLFRNSCIEECVEGTAVMENRETGGLECLTCESPCAKCAGGSKRCTQCDGLNGKKFLFDSTCWTDCPAGTTPNNEKLTCLKCKDDCDLCQLDDDSKCLKCKKPKIAHEGVCLEQCPDGFAPDETGQACRPWQLSDLGIIYYPWLLAALIGTLVSCFGIMRRRAVIFRGKIWMMSPQNTLTCIIVVIAPLQFLATVCQWLLSIIYGTTTFAILAAVVSLAACIINIAWMFVFINSFDSQRLPMEIERKVRLGKAKRSECRKFLEPKDPKFDTYKLQYRLLVYWTYLLQSTLAWKVNKSFYSHFYDLRPFQAPFSRAKTYRKKLIMFEIVHLICVDLLLVCINVTALTQIEPGNQLFITLQEVLILSLLSIALGAWELRQLKTYLKYTEEIRDKSVLRIDTDTEDEANLDKKFDRKKMLERQTMMAKLLKQVKHNKQLFLNNKLDELIHSFGDRRCRSACDQATGWDLVDDPQLRITYPVSPTLRLEFQESGITFQARDQLPDSSAALAQALKKRQTTKAENIDESDHVVKQALQRKQVHAGIQCGRPPSGDYKSASPKKRGRKNRFQTAIEAEDRNQPVEASDDEAAKVVKSQKQKAEDEKRRQKEAAKQAALAAQKEKDLKEAERRATLQAQREAQQLAQKKKLQEQEDLKKQEKEKKQELLKQQKEERLTREKELLAKKEREEALKRERELQKMREVNWPERAIRVPPRESDRMFNENDILGEFDRDSKLRALVTRASDGLFYDKLGRRTNEKGYLIDSASLALMERYSKQTMFHPSQLDEGGEIPAPFYLERFNFNPHEMMGDFDFTEKGIPDVIKTADGAFVDKRGRKVNKHGWYFKEDSKELIDIYQHKMFDKCHLTDGDLPKLFNYAGKRYDIREVIGQFEKDSYGKIIIHKSDKGQLDNLGRLVNEKGYLTDKNGNIISSNGGSVIFKKSELRSGEPPKFFPFSQFCLKRVQGEPPIIRKAGKAIDAKGRLVNQKGFFVDEQGNIVDYRNDKVFDKQLLDKDGNLPKLFTSKLLQQESAKSFERLKQQINRYVPSIDPDAAQPRLDTSLDSQMEDTPANYDSINQRGQSSVVVEGVHRQKMNKDSSRSRMKSVTVLQPTRREKQTASAYGGEAIGSIKRPGIKYDKERLDGSKKFRIQPGDEPNLKAQLASLIASTTSNKNIRDRSLSSRKDSGQGSARGHSNHKRDKLKVRDGDFEDIFGQEMDNVLQDPDSARPIESLANLEKDYLKVEHSRKVSPRKNNISPSPDMARKASQSSFMKGPDRELMINFSDNPGVIHRGEILPFHTKKAYEK